MWRDARHPINIQAGQLRRDILAITKIHLRWTYLFNEARVRGARLLMTSYEEDVTYLDVAETGFAQTIWHLFNYGLSSSPPTPIELWEWVSCDAAVQFLTLLADAGKSGAALTHEEQQAVSRCLVICKRANDRFTSTAKWLPFYR